MSEKTGYFLVILKRNAFANNITDSAKSAGKTMPDFIQYTENPVNIF
jgi:hypothetical protein